MLLKFLARVRHNCVVPLSLVIFIVVLFASGKTWAITLTTDTIWQGVVEVEEDILVPKGITLTILPATTVKIHPAESTKTDPEYLSHLTEITIRGTLLVQGTKTHPVIFTLIDPHPEETQWAGIIIDQGTAHFTYSKILRAETGLQVFSGQVNVIDSILENNHYAITAHGQDSTITLRNTIVHKNDFGLLSMAGATIKQENCLVSNNRKKDAMHLETYKQLPLLDTVSKPANDLISRIYKNDVLLGTTVWQGKIVIEGLIRLPPDARLIILPGTLIEFTKRDTNGDGLGENGMMIQGVLIAKGTAEKPIIFRSAEDNKTPGDWDSINILGSDRTQNLVEFCQIQDAYRGMHFHFSNVTVNNCILFNNYRGIQFQESLVTVKNNSLFANKSGIRARDSQVIFTNNKVYNNLNGAHFFRLDLQSSNNTLANNAENGMRIREGAASVLHNTFVGNRVGLLINQAEFGKFNQNLISHNLENGIAMRDCDHLEINGNSLQANGVNGIIVRDSRAAIRHNLITDNGERGIGAISFSGEISQNNITENRLYAIGLDGANNLAAPQNWWGNSDLNLEIYDRTDDPDLGIVDVSNPNIKPISFPWPVANIPVDLTWHGTIMVPQSLTVDQDATLEIKPGTNVAFEKKTGLEIFGKILALGAEDKRIRFSSVAQKGPEDWQEISLDRATGSQFINCDFEYATWGIHSHFVDLIIRGCTFSNNDGGLRFRSGPMQVTQSIFKNNRIGIRSFLGNGSINNNTISANEIGIFVRQGGSGIKIHQNNITDNSRYGIRLGDFNSDNVDAAHNWWGDVAPQNTIFDGQNESYIGRVQFNPILNNPVEVHGFE